VRKVIFLFSLLILLNSCYEDKTGCLDKLASNYDVSADIPCEDNCCTYPKLNLKFTHSFKNGNLTLNSSLQNDINSSFVLLSQKLFLSNICLFESSNSLKVPFVRKGPYILNNGSTSEFIKDYILLTDVNTLLQVNEFKSNQKLNNLKLKLGLDNKFDNVDIVRASNYIELDEFSGMYEKTSKTYLSYSAKMAVGNNLRDTFTITLNNEIDKNLSLGNVQSKFGEDISIDVKLNYDKLFSGVNFTSGSQAIRVKLASNFQNFID
jgi:hypothetical protein